MTALPNSWKDFVIGILIAFFTFTAPIAYFNITNSLKDLKQGQQDILQVQVNTKDRLDGLDQKNIDFKERFKGIEGRLDVMDKENTEFYKKNWYLRKPQDQSDISISSSNYAYIDKKYQDSLIYGTY